jgi:hypothetical protein
MTFAAGFLLLVWVVSSILLNGIALLHHFTKLRGLELVGYGAGQAWFVMGFSAGGSRPLQASGGYLSPCSSR